MTTLRGQGMNYLPWVLLQVSYMGFPGTTGAKYIDYLVTDEFVSPLCCSNIYSQKIVHLPHCYFVNDYKELRRSSKLLLTRLLPQDQIVGCSAKWEIVQEEVEIVVYLQGGC